MVAATLRAAVLVLILDILPMAFAQVDPAQFAPADTIHRDIAIIGGGASGAHAAVRLREDFNKSIVVIEKRDKLVSLLCGQRGFR